MDRYVVAIPAGQGPQERARVGDLVAALAVHEPLPPAVVVVDDAPAERRAWPAGVAVLPNPRRGRGIGTLGGTTAATLAALAWAHAAQPGAWVLRLDTDAAVLGPVGAPVAAAWRPGDGVLGSCTRSCTGAVRDVSAIAREVHRHERPVWAWARPPRRRWAGVVRPADPFVRGVLRAARSGGYRPGEHCVAGACALSGALVGALAARGWLERPERWLAVRLGDDMVLGAMARACGLGLRDLPAVFGVAHAGLPASPEALLAAGHAVVHSVKGPDEARARAVFAAAGGWDAAPAGAAA